MAYCNIQNDFLGKKLDNQFYENNRNLIASLIESKDFKDWFGNGKKDFEEKNPLIDGALSFTNEKGQKKTIFDFGFVGLSNQADTFRLLNSFKATFLHKGEMFINNTLKDATGKHSAEILMNAINVINYYYPNAISIERYDRSQLSPFTRGDIPLFIIKINKNVSYQKSHEMFSIYDTKQISKDEKKYNQLASTEEIFKLQALLHEYKPTLYSRQELEKLTTKPDVSQQTFNKLKEFFLKLNPNARIEELDNLSSNGIAYISKFLIELNTASKYSAMPEEVAHFFFEMLPIDSSMRKDMMSNITSFGIYQMTLATYGDLPDYQKEGKTDYDKIKKEAAGKLIAEYIYAQTSGDNNRITALTRVNQGFIANLWERIVSWISNALNISKKDRLDAYMKAARDILNGEADYLTMENITPNSGIYLDYNEKNKTQLAISTTIMTQLDTTETGLQEMSVAMNNVKKEINKSLRLMRTRKELKVLDDALSEEEDSDDTNNKTKVNRMAVHAEFLRRTEIDPALRAMDQIDSMQRFIGTILGMNEMAKAFEQIVDSYVGSRDVLHIPELQLFQSTYRNLQTIVNSDLATILIKSGVQSEIVETLRQSMSKFSSIETKIRGMLKILYTEDFKNKFSPQNDVIMRVLGDDLKLILNQSTQKTMEDKIKQRVDEYTAMLKSGKSKSSSTITFLEALKKDGVSERALTSPLLKRMFEHVENLYTSDQMISDFMEGTGTDMDLISYGTHYITAATKNHHLFTANLAKMIVNRRSAAQNLAMISIGEYNSIVDPILKKLRAAGLDEYAVGLLSTFEDVVFDNTPTGKNKEPRKDNKRSIISFIKPTSGTVDHDKKLLLDARTAAKRAYESSDKNSDIGKALKQASRQADKDFRTHTRKYYNSPFKKVYNDFQDKWEQDDEITEMREEYAKLSEKAKEALEAYERDLGNLERWGEFLEAQRAKYNLRNPEGKTEAEKKIIEKFDKYFEESNAFRIEDKVKTKKNYEAAKRNYLNKVQNALGVFISDGGKGKLAGEDDLDLLQRIIQEQMRDTTILVKAQYKLETVRDPALTKNNVEKQDDIDTIIIMLMDRFKKRSVTRVRTAKSFELQKILTEQIKELKAKNQLSPIDELISSMYDKMSAIMLGRSDYYGQRNSEAITNINERNQVIDLEDRIQEIKEYNIKSFAITPEMRSNPRARNIDFDKYEKNLKAAYEIFIKDNIDDNDRDKLKNIKTEIASDNLYMVDNKLLSDEQIDIAQKIKDRYDELATLSNKKPTQAYWDRMESFIDVFERILTKKQVAKEDPKLTTGEKLVLKAEIDNLARLVGGTDGQGGLRAAIYENNHDLLDDIINDKYDIGGSTVEFMKYLREPEQGTSSKSYIGDIDDATYDLSEWFRENHKEGVIYREKTTTVLGIDYNSFERLERNNVRRIYATYAEPSDDTEYYEDYLMWEDAYSRRYRATKINDDPVTGFVKDKVTYEDSDDIEDWTVDNKESNPEFLPMSRKQLIAAGKTDFKYVNKAYYDIFDKTDSKSKDIQDFVKASLKVYLAEQKTKGDEIKSMFKLPVTVLDSYEKGKAYLSEEAFKRRKDYISSIFKDSEAVSSEEQLKGLSEKMDINEYTNEVVSGRIPKLGMNSKLPVERVNRNVLSAVTQYIQHSKDFDARVDLKPFVQGLVEVMNDNKTQGRVGQNRSLDVVEKVYSQMILEEEPDNITNSEFFKRMAGIISHMSGLKLLADITGGAINYIQANVNNLIEATAREHATPGSYAVGFKEAFTMMAHLGADYNKRSDLNYWTLMLQSFQFVEGEIEEDMIERTSKQQKNSWYQWQKWFMYPRKAGELQAQSAMSIAIMDMYKVENSIDGKEYPMWDIYKRNKDGTNLELKEGFDKEKYNPVNGTVYESVKGRIHGVNRELHGNYDKLNATEASRHSIGKMVESMKRWFVPALMRRFGRVSYDVMSELITEGYYRSTVEMGFNILKEMGKLNFDYANSWLQFNLASPRKQKNLLRTAADIVAAIVLFMAGSLMGYSGDDPDKNKKLANNSWLYNEALLVMLRTYSEQTAFIPVPPFGFTELSRNLLDPFSVAKSSFGNAAGTVSLATFTLLYYLGADSFSSKAIYSKDIGLGKGQTIFDAMGLDVELTGQKGDLKINNYLLKMLGVNWSQIDPTYYIKNFESLQKKIK